MRPEAAAGAREARGRVCPCPADGPRRPASPRGPESPAPWRPWALTPRDAEPSRAGSQLEPGGDQQTSGSKGAFGFQHPVRLYLPISKRQEYLQSSGEKVLASFPVQATIHFYNDESDSEDGEHEEEAQGPGAESPGDTGRGPGDTECGPGDTERGPGDTGRGPGDTECGPGDTGRGPGDTGCGPGDTECGPGDMGRGPGGRGRDQPTHPAPRSGGHEGLGVHGGLGGKGGLPHGDSPGGAKCSSSK